LTAYDLSSRHFPAIAKCDNWCTLRDLGVEYHKTTNLGHFRTVDTNRGADNIRVHANAESRSASRYASALARQDKQEQTTQR